MDKCCETCKSFKKVKCFTADGACYLVPSKPKFVRKKDSCKFHTKKQEGD